MLLAHPDCAAVQHRADRLLVQGQERQKALEQALLEERAQRAGLDLQVRALCAELTRASDTTGELRSVGWTSLIAEYKRLRGKLCSWWYQTLVPWT